MIIIKNSINKVLAKAKKLGYKEHGMVEASVYHLLKMDLDEELIVDLYAEFKNQIEEFSFQLRSNVEAGNFLWVGAKTHEMKGVSRNLKLDPLAAALEMISTEVKSENIHQIQTSCEQYFKQVGELIPRIKDSL